jgi:hypothetical protein
LLDRAANVYNADESEFPQNNKPPDKVFSGLNAREIAKNGTKKTVLGFEAGFSSCVKMADFNPCYIKEKIYSLHMHSNKYSKLLVRRSYRKF